MTGSIGNRLRRAFSHWTEKWEDRTAQSRAPSYEDARAQLGGAAWREVPNSTDSWFVDGDVALETGPMEADRRDWRRIALVGAGVLGGFVLVFMVVGRSSRHGALPAAVPAVLAAPSAPEALARSGERSEPAPPLVVKKRRLRSRPSNERAVSSLSPRATRR
jgi:hypothetical protein